MADNRDTIRERLFNEIDNKYDKSTGSLVWEQGQGLAIELENQYVIADDALAQSFAGTADFEHLKIKAYEHGVDWKDATKASGIVRMTGSIGKVIPVGTLVASELNQYVVTEQNTIGTDGIALVKVECITAGVTGNTPANTITIFPKTIAGLNIVTNTDAFNNGYNEESRDDLLARYYLTIRQPATSGNAYHYRQWALEIDGVGDAKIKLIWEGGGTVKVVIIDRNKTVASSELISDVATYIESVRPIGATVTVVSAEELVIDVNCLLTIKEGYTLEQVKTNIQNGFNQYFKDVAFVEEKIIYAKMGNIVYDTEGVSDLDYASFTLNGMNANILLEDNNTKTQIPKLGTLTATVS